MNVDADVRPWSALARFCAAATAATSLLAGALILWYALSLAGAHSWGLHLSGAYLRIACVVMATAAPYVVAWVGLRAHRRWAIWLLGVAALIQGSYETLHFVRAVQRAWIIYSRFTLANTWLFLVIVAHVLLLGLTIFAAARLLAATRPDRRHGFPVNMPAAPRVSA